MSHTKAQLDRYPESVNAQPNNRLKLQLSTEIGIIELILI